MPRQMLWRRAGSVEKAPRMPGPPLPMVTLVTLWAQSRARALMVHSGMPVFSLAQAGVLGSPSSLPST